MGDTCGLSWKSPVCTIAPTLNICRANAAEDAVRGVPGEPPISALRSVLMPQFFCGISAALEEVGVVLGESLLHCPNDVVARHVLPGN